MIDRQYEYLLGLQKKKKRFQKSKKKKKMKKENQKIKSRKKNYKK